MELFNIQVLLFIILKTLQHWKVQSTSQQFFFILPSFNLNANRDNIQSPDIPLTFIENLDCSKFMNNSSELAYFICEIIHQI